MPELLPSPITLVLLATGTTMSFFTRWLNFCEALLTLDLVSHLKMHGMKRRETAKFGIRAKLTTASLAYKFIKPLALVILWDLAIAKVYKPIYIDDVVTHFGVFYELLPIFCGDLLAVVSTKIWLCTQSFYLS